MKKLFVAFVATLVFLLMPFMVDAQDVSWEAANGPAGGRVLDIAFNSQEHVFTCVEDVGVFRSLDNGANWVRVNSGLTDLSVSALTINSRGHLFVGTKNGKVFRSIDNGESWTLTRDDLPKTFISGLVINSADHIFVGTINAGIYRSTDNGETWLPPASVREITSLVANPNGDLYASTYWYGVIRSTDDGKNWTSVNNGIPKNGYPAHNGLWHWAYDVAIHPSGDIFAGAGGGLYRSKDNGESWVKLTDGWFLSIAFNSLGHIFVGANTGFYGTGIQGVYRSTDDGVSWVRIDSGFTSYAIHSLAINSSNHVFAGSDRIHQSVDNGDDWTLLGGLAYNSYSLAVNVSGTIFAGTNGYGIFRTIDEGDTWLQINNGLTDLKIFALTANATGHVFAGTHTGKLYRSTDNGDSWKHIFTLRERGVVDPSALSFAVNSSGNIFVGSAFAGIWRSSDNGDSWAKVFSAGSSYVNAIVINSSEHVFASTASYYGGGSVFRSIDGGDNWSRVYTTRSFGGIKALMAHANTVFAGYEGYAGGSGGAIRSNDNGDNWELVNTNLNGAVYAFTNMNAQIFAGTTTAVFDSKNNGDSWGHLSTGWPRSTGVRGLKINPPLRIFAATNRGVYRSANRLGTAVHEREVAAEPNSFMIIQNYPNPFNPSTKIRFILPRATQVIVRVFDATGREVATLLEGALAEGPHTFVWDGKSTAGEPVRSGVYFLRLEAGGEVAVHKMAVVR